MKNPGIFEKINAYLYDDTVWKSFDRFVVGGFSVEL
jgi:hypothetical protein